MPKYIRNRFIVISAAIVILAVASAIIHGNNDTGGGFHLQVGEMAEVFGLYPREGDVITITWSADDPNIVEEIERVSTTEIGEIMDELRAKSDGSKYARQD